jgi:hypothetical protein
LMRLLAERSAPTRRAAESACRPGLSPESVRPAAKHYKPAVTCDYVLNGSRRIVPDQDTMCPECARPRAAAPSEACSLRL